MLVRTWASAVMIAALGMLAGPGQAQTTWHVDADAPHGGDGLDSSTAYKYIQDALAPAGNGASWVAALPGQDRVSSPDPHKKPEGSHEPPGLCCDRVFRFPTQLNGRNQ